MNVRVGDPFSSHQAVSVAPLVTPVVVCGTSLWSMARPGVSAKVELSPFHVTMNALTQAGFRTPLVLAHASNQRLMGRLLREAKVSSSALYLAEHTSSKAAVLRDIAAELAMSDPAALLLIAPDDMSRIDRTGLEEAIALVLPSVREGRIACFGFDSTYPATDELWLRASDNLQIVSSVNATGSVPERKDAVQRHADRNWFWNAGLYLVSARTLAGLEDASGSIDHMMLASRDNLLMVKLDAGWSKNGRASEEAVAMPQTDILADGQDFQVRRLTLLPGGSLELVSQTQTSTYWTIASGTGRLRSRMGSRDVASGGSLSVPIGETHRIFNTSSAPLVLIEVQAGAPVGKVSLRQAAA